MRWYFDRHITDEDLSICAKTCVQDEKEDEDIEEKVD